MEGSRERAGEELLGQVWRPGRSCLAAAGGVSEKPPKKPAVGAAAKGDAWRENLLRGAGRGRGSAPCPPLPLRGD